jgi:hypothetical protein
MRVRPESILEMAVQVRPPRYLVRPGSGSLRKSEAAPGIGGFS